MAERQRGASHAASRCACTAQTASTATRLATENLDAVASSSTRRPPATTLTNGGGRRELTGHDGVPGPERPPDARMSRQEPRWNQQTLQDSREIVGLLPAAELERLAGVQPDLCCEGGGQAVEGRGKAVKRQCKGSEQSRKGSAKAVNSQ